MSVKRLLGTVLATVLLPLVSSATVYYIGPAGSDGNSGLDAENPLAGFQTALAKADVTEIRLLEGDYQNLPTAASARGGCTDCDYIAEVTIPVVISGAGPDKTILHCRKNAGKGLFGFYVNHADARIAGLTVRDGGYPSTQKEDPWGLDIVAGTVSNCSFICGGVTSTADPVVRINGANAFVTDCVVSNNHKSATNLKYANVMVKNGRLEDTLIADNWGGDGSTGHGLSISGGIVRRCTISDHDGDGLGTIAGGVYITGGTLADSKILRNLHSGRSATGSTAGGCVVNGAAIVTNCLFAGNIDGAFDSTSAGGLFVVHANAKVYDCTFADNVSHHGGPQFRMSAGTASGILVESGNGVPSYVHSGGTLNSIEVSDAPGFIDRENFELPHVSPLRTFGWRQSVAPETATATVLLGKYRYRAGSSVVATAVVENASASSYSWLLTCGENVSAPEGGDTISLSNLAAGEYELEVTVDGELISRPVKFIVQPAKCYVSATGGDGVAPYDDPSKATSKLQLAHDAVYADLDTPGEIEIAAGIYDNLDPKQLIFRNEACRHLIVTKPVDIHGATGDAADVTIKHNSSSSYYLGGILIGNPLARLSSVTLTSKFAAYDNSWCQLSGVLELESGTVSNVVVTGCDCAKNSHYMPCVSIHAGGVMTHSKINDNRYNSSSWGRYAVGARVNNGQLISSEVKRNWIKTAQSDRAVANGVVMEGANAKVVDCIIEGNSGGAGAVTATGGGVKMSNGLLERCIIQCNTNVCGTTGNSAQTAGGVYVGGGTMRNCLVAANVNMSTSADSAGGIYIGSSASVQHCTVVNNFANGGVGGVVQNGNTLHASVISGNTGTQVKLVSTAAPDYCVFHEATGSVGTGNTSSAAMFKDDTVAFPVDRETAGAYSITKSSGGYNMVRQQYATDDLLGTERPTIDPEGTDFPDAGAMEMIPSAELVEFITASAETAGTGESVTFEVTLDGADTSIKSVTWIVDYGDMSVTNVTTAGTYVFQPPVAGAYTITCIAENDSGEKAAAKSVSFSSLPRVTYVSLTGSNTWPYDEASKAAANLADAVDATFCESGRPGVVHVLPGEYTTMEEKATGSGATYLAYLAKPIKVIGRDGPDETRIVLTPDDQGHGVFVADSQALFSGITLSGKYNSTYGGWAANAYNNSGAALTVLSGVASNCVVTGMVPAGGHVMPPVMVNGGTLTQSKVIDNDHKDSAWGRGPLGVFLKSGTVMDCEISRNRLGLAHYDLMEAGGVLQTGGVVSNCVISGNIAGPKSSGGYTVAAGLKASAGEVWNTAIFANTNNAQQSSNRQASGLAASGTAKIRNVLVSDNVYNGILTTDSPAVLVTAAGVNAANLTIAGNTNALDTATVSGLYLSAGTVVNTIVWGNTSFAGANYVNAGGTFTTGCAEDPSFLPSKGRPYRLGRSSCCIDAGTSLDWMSLTTDLLGNPRVKGKGPDIGCFENPLLGTMLIVR